MTCHLNNKSIIKMTWMLKYDHYFVANIMRWLARNQEADARGIHKTWFLLTQVFIYYTTCMKMKLNKPLILFKVFFSLPFSIKKQNFIQGKYVIVYLNFIINKIFYWIYYALYLWWRQFSFFACTHMIPEKVGFHYTTCTFKIVTHHFNQCLLFSLFKTLPSFYFPVRYILVSKNGPI